MKTVIFICICLFYIPVSSKCQEKISIFYNLDWEVTNQNKASFIRETEFDTTTLKQNGKVSDFDTTGKLLMEGYYSEGLRTGFFTFFYPNGIVKNKGEYLNAKRVGNWEYYYINGKLKQRIIFPHKKHETDFIVTEYYDRNGNQLIKDGSGKWENDSIQVFILDKASYQNLTGQFKDSLKQGEWELTRISDNKLLHSERFRKGNFVEATIFSPHSNSYGSLSSEVMTKFPDENQLKFTNTENFTLDTTVFGASLTHADFGTILKAVTGKDFQIQERVASYAYGNASLFEFISTNIRYPVNAMHQHISGTVYINVEIDASGNVGDVKILRGVQKDINNEALRVIQLIKDWLPAIQNGIKIQSTITIPVKFEIII